MSDVATLEQTEVKPEESLKAVMAVKAERYRDLGKLQGDRELENDEIEELKVLTQLAIDKKFDVSLKEEDIRGFVDVDEKNQQPMTFDQQKAESDKININSVEKGITPAEQLRLKYLSEQMKKAQESEKSNNPAKPAESAEPANLSSSKFFATAKKGR